MSQHSVLNPESSSCLLLSYKRDTYILKLGEELKQLMKNDIEQLLKQEGVVYRHLTLPLSNSTLDHIRLNGGFNRREPGIQRQIITKDDGPVRRSAKPITLNPETVEKFVQTENPQKDFSEELDLKSHIFKMQKDIEKMVKKLNSIESKDGRVGSIQHKATPTELITMENAPVSSSLSQSSSIKKVVSKKKWNLCQFCSNALVPKNGRQVAAEIRRLTGDSTGQNILLAVVAEPEYYHINVICISTGRCLGCVLAKETGFWHVETQLKLADFTTFYISPQAVTSSNENTNKFDVYFQYIRQANKRKRLRDELRNKRAN